MDNVILIRIATAFLVVIQVVILIFRLTQKARAKAGPPALRLGSTHHT